MPKTKSDGKTLVIVESFAKTTKIQQILGNEYVVMASGGHIMDLDDKTISVEIENKFKPIYSKVKGKESIIKNLKAAAKGAIDVLLATDKDREGEMIALNLAEVLNLEKPKRIVFGSITKDEIIKAIKNPKNIDMNMVNSQKTRRILDRIVGYEVSPILWKNIGESLSAGRVQSVVVRLLLDREREITKFFNGDTQSSYRFIGTFVDKNNKEFKATLVKTSSTIKSNKSKDDDIDELDETENIDASDDEIKTKTIKSGKTNIKTEKEVKDLLKITMNSTFKLSDVLERDSIRQPSAPFTTSTLQQEAARKLGFSVKRTMCAAQTLYEAGKITYMRTDSVGLSPEALKNIEKFIVHEYGKEYFRRFEYITKKKNTQEAHEAVRPTDVNTKGVSIEGKIGNDEMRLYALIWKRTVASQMSPAKFKIKNVQISISKTEEYIFNTQIETPVFAGFLTVYNLANLEKEVEGEDKELQTVELPKIGSKIKIKNVLANQEYDRPAPRYNEASLVNKMDPKNLNIGRPATYGAIITKIQERKYVEKKDIDGVQKDSKTFVWMSTKSTIDESTKKIWIGKETGKLVPTPMGMIVTDFLIEHFTEIMDYQFTSTMEDQLDEIEEGERVWYKLLEEFYRKFHKIVEKLSKQQLKIMDKNRKVLGIDEKTGKDIVATMKKYGPVVLIDNGDKKPLNIAPIKLPLTIDTITLDGAIEILAYPKCLGKYDGKQIKLCTGKFGLYVKHGDTNYSLKDVDDFDEDVDEDELLDKIIEVIKDKKENSNVLWEKKDGKISYTILNGQYGRYINIKDSSKKMSKGTNVKFPKGDDNCDDIENMTIEKIKEIINKNKTNGFKKSGYKKFKKD